jgi:uncharacterized protein
MATAIVTGASSGIGEALAGLLAADGHTLILVARSKEGLDAVALQLREKYGVQIHVVPADLSDPASPRRIADAVESLGLNPDYLVNNAGFGMLGMFVQQDEAQLAGMVQVNISSLVILTRLLLPGMIARGSGRIMNVASVAGFMPGPLMAVYYATKAFVISFSEALANELRGSGVTVTCLCPGPTRTEFQKRSGMHRLSFFKGPFSMDVAPVVRKAYTAMKRGQVLVIPGLANWLLPVVLRLLPRPLVPRLVRSIQSKT